MFRASIRTSCSKGGAGTGANKPNRRRYGLMVIAEIGFSLALLSGAALVVRTAIQIHTVDIGFDPHPITSATVILRADRDTAINAPGYLSALRTSILAIPDVADVAVTRNQATVGNTITANERDGTPHEINAPSYAYRIVTPSWFRTAGLSILKGRDFGDGLPSEPEVVVDEHTANAVWPGVDPIGQRSSSANTNRMRRGYVSSA